VADKVKQARGIADEHLKAHRGGKKQKGLRSIHDGALAHCNAASRTVSRGRMIEPVD
jgi:hypothetical protein